MSLNWLRERARTDKKRRVPAQKMLQCVRWALLGAGLWAGAAFAQSADLLINHSDSPDPGPAGGIFTYTMRVDNNSATDTALNVVLTDTLPSSAVFIDAVTTAGACTALVGTTFSCNLGSIAPLANQTVTLRVRLPVMGVYQNGATVASDTLDPNPANNTNNQESTTVVAAADMAILATPSSANVVAGATYSYTLKATNNGPDAAGNSQQITFAVPAGASILGTSGSGWGCTPASSAASPLSTGTVTCTRNGPLASGGTAADLVVDAVSHTNGSVTAAFAVSALQGVNGSGLPMPDSNAANDTAVATVNSAPGSDVAVTKTAANNVGLGESVTYTLTPRLNGGMALTVEPITVTEVPGPGLTVTGMSGVGWTCNVATLTCTRPGYSGVNYSDMPTIVVVATANAAGTLSNGASIGTAQPDPVPGNNSANKGVTSSNDADVRMQKSASLTTVHVNQAFTYTLGFTNLGPLGVPAGQSITLTDSVPAGITINSVSGLPPGWACTPSSGSFPLVGGVGVTLGCSGTGPLAVNSSQSLALNAVSTAAGTSTNTVCVALGAGGRVDPASGNDCASRAITTSVDQANLEVVSKTASPASVKTGQDLTYVITVGNKGPAVATSVQVQDILSNLISTGGFQSATPSQGTCTPSAVTNGTSQTLNCNIGTLGVGATATVTVVVRPLVALTANRTNTATVNSTDIGDPDRSNNSASVTSQVTALTDATLLKTATPLSVPASGPVTYVATVRNDGPSTASTVTLNDTLPSNAAFIALDTITGGGTCSTTPAANAVGGTLVCIWPSIVTATQHTVTYRVRPLASAAGSNLVNTAAVTTTTEESNAANNTATTSTPVTAANLDVLINKVDSVDPVILGNTTKYTIRVTNSSGSQSYGTNVVMTDVFPAPGKTATAVFSYQGGLTVDSGGACDTPPAVGAISGTLVCRFPSLAPGQAATVTYDMRAETLTVSGATSGTAWNDAKVTVDEPETTAANNTTIHDTTTRRDLIATDLGITKTGPAGPLAAGAAVNYVLTVVNNGPLASNGGQVIDDLPAGLEFVSGAGCVYAAAERRVSCTVGALASGTSKVFNLQTRLSSPYSGAGPLVNTARVDALGDTVPGNNQSTASTPVQPALPGGVASIPTLSEWGLILLSGLLGLLALRQMPAARRW